MTLYNKYSKRFIKHSIQQWHDIYSLKCTSMFCKIDHRQGHETLFNKINFLKLYKVCPLHRMKWNLEINTEKWEMNKYEEISNL